MQTFFLATLCAAGTLLAEETIDAFGHKWTVPLASEWKVEKEGTGEVLKLVVKRPQEKAPRRPVQYALAELGPFEKVTLEAEVKRNEKSLILVYAWKDRDHFNYAHLSVDYAVKQPVHNGIFHVYGGDRSRISLEDAPPSLPTGDWTKVKLIFDGKTGHCHVEVNGQKNAALEAVDLSLRAGKVGLGSFFETGQFRNVKITGR